MSNFTLRTTCRACLSEKLKPILSLGDQAITGFSKEAEEAVRIPLDLVLCTDCMLLQLEHTTNPSLLYNNNYGYRSNINQTMRDELKGIVENVTRMIDLTPGDRVIDIGCNDGTLLSNYPKGVVTIGFDPSPNVLEYADIDIKINDYFCIESYPDHVQAKVITAISMFYDLDNPDKFLKDITDLLHPDGIFIIQQNYLVGMLQQLAFDNICHEHLEYYSLLSLENLLKRHDLEVFDVEERSLNGGSFRTYIQHKGGKHAVSGKVVQMREKEKALHLDGIEIYADFAKRVWNVADQLNRFITQAVKKGKTVFVYGASTRGNTLLQAANLDYRQITFAAERNPDKYGQVMIGTDIPIIAERIARRLKPDYFLVLPWFFKKEFIEREKEYLTSGGKLVFPLPKFEVV